MKITRLILGNYQQFKHLDIDLTYPKGHDRAGEPLDKVCFIGKNGTGKSTILNSIKSLLKNDSSFLETKTNFRTEYTKAYGGIYINNVNFDFENLYDGIQKKNFDFYIGKLVLENDINWQHKFINLPIEKDYILNFYSASEVDKTRMYNFLTNEFKTKYTNRIINILGLTKSLVTYSPAESKNNKSLDADFSTFATRGQAADLFNKTTIYAEISYEHLLDFWKNIIFKVLERGNQQDEYFKRQENKNKTIAEVEMAFELEYPNYLKELSKIWNNILSSSGLYFDYEKAQYPKQLNDKLEVFIKTKKDNTIVPTHLLSTGIRHLLFRLGFLHALYYKRDLQSGFAIIDEPENSFFPDVLLKLTDWYTNPQTFPNTQFFFATHSPIFAAQFDPAERIILDFDDDYNVIWRRGSAPEGDDPNDLLYRDFHVESVMGPKGNEMWELYLSLQKRLRNSKTDEEKELLRHKILEIGNQYNF